MGVSPAGGVATAVTEVDVPRESSITRGPPSSPDRKHFYYSLGPPDGEGMYLFSRRRRPGDQSRQRLLTNSVPAVYAKGDVSSREGTLMANHSTLSAWSSRACR